MSVNVHRFVCKCASDVGTRMHVLKQFVPLLGRCSGRCFWEVHFCIAPHSVTNSKNACPRTLSTSRVPDSYDHAYIHTNIFTYIRANKIGMLRYKPHRWAGIPLHRRRRPSAPSFRPACPSRTSDAPRARTPATSTHDRAADN